MHENKYEKLGFDYYESILEYSDRMLLQEEFEKFYILKKHGFRESAFYRWLGKNKVKNFDHEKLDKV
jgi:hypothetical protein